MCISMNKIPVISRSLTIPVSDVGKIRAVHNGKVKCYIRVLPEIVGRKYGDIAKTRKYKPVYKGAKRGSKKR